ncbi:MAG: HAD-IIB family hydrolase [Anaerolineales bacterium]|nr:HAD-IIB family hydrolase [Anaerolineales bacterium]
MPLPVIFTDLDGTLLDFNTYSSARALPAVTRLLARGIPIVLCSSKTRREQFQYRTAFHLPDPFIVENGSAIYLPRGYFSPPAFAPAGLPNPADPYETIVLGTPAAEIRAHLVHIRAETGLNFSTYDDLPLPDICRITGLSPAQAEAARAREYSATILTPLARGDHARLTAALASVGLQLLAGGRFHTVTGAGTDKGRAVRQMADFYRQKFGAIITLGLGDSANDRAMLAAVDHPYLVQKPDQTWEMDIPATKIEGVGPEGWCKVAEQLLAQPRQ